VEDLADRARSMHPQAVLHHEEGFAFEVHREMP
jgi:hypothetical protein